MQCLLIMMPRGDQKTTEKMMRKCFGGIEAVKRAGFWRKNFE
jgi:hypothetical protein